MSVKIPLNGFNVSYDKRFHKDTAKFIKKFESKKSLIKRLQEVIQKLPMDIYDKDLDFHKIQKSKNFPYKYCYSVTIQKPYQIVLTFDDGKTNPEDNDPQDILLIYIGDYH